MSIIDQALKKTQQALEKKEVIVTPEVKSQSEQFITRAQEKIAAENKVPEKKTPEKKITEKKPSPFKPVAHKPSARFNTKSRKFFFMLCSMVTLIVFMLALMNTEPKFFLAYHHKLASPILVLNGTMHMGDHKAAEINHKLYQIGQNIGSFEITDIQFNEVDLKNLATGQTQKLTEKLTT